MIKIIFIEPETKKWKSWKEKCNNETKEIIKAFRQGNKKKIKQIYSDQYIRKNIYFSNDSPFYGKCAYCEKKISTHNHIDHFRPKGEVRDIRNNKVCIKQGTDKDIVHPGYYWLAYDWTNLLPACIDCNKIREQDGIYIGKGNRFPVKGKYTITPDDNLSHEKPLLINPVTENPDKYLKICTDTGFIASKNGNERGKTSIDVLGLNKNRLPEERIKKKIICNYNIRKLIKEKKLDDVKEYITNIKNGKCEYSMIAKAVINKILL